MAGGVYGVKVLRGISSASLRDAGETLVQVENMEHFLSVTHSVYRNLTANDHPINAAFAHVDFNQVVAPIAAEYNSFLMARNELFRYLACLGR